MGKPTGDRDLKGWLNALVAFGWWGFIFPLVVILINYLGRDEISSAQRWIFEFLGWRIIFCLLFCLGLLWFTEKIGLFIKVFSNRQLLLGFALSAFLIFLNWVGFVAGVVTENISQASLGYYMGPLFNVFLAYLFLGERLRRPQFLAVIVSGIGVLWLTYKAGEFPWIALCLATSFGFYGLVRKKLNVDSVVGMTMECLYCLPVCIAILLIYYSQPEGLVFLQSNNSLRLAILFTGPATAIPLICFAIAARRLRLGTLGFIQFIAPTGQLLLAMIFDNKPITGEKLLGYGFVWLAVVIYLADLWYHQRIIAAEKSEPE